MDRVQIIVILQHHLVHFKNGCTGFAHFLDRLVIQLLQLFLCLRPRLLKTGKLSIHVRDLGPLYLLVIFLQDRHRTDNNPLINRFSG